jgi:hypothetical protein
MQRAKLLVLFQIPHQTTEQSGRRGRTSRAAEGGGRRQCNNELPRPLLGSSHITVDLLSAAAQPRRAGRGGVAVLSSREKPRRWTRSRGRKRANRFWMSSRRSGAAWCIEGQEIAASESGATRYACYQRDSLAASSLFDVLPAQRAMPMP